MIKFFRKIRERLLTENKFSKYLLYAIGEIALVVIGILIALQINNSNENRIQENELGDLMKSISIAIQSDIKSLKLIKTGSFSTGQMLSKEPTVGHVSINEVDYPIYKYEFQFFAKGRDRIAECKTYKTHLVEDEVEEFILYDYVEPSVNVVYDAIPNAPDFDRLGQMKQVSFKKAYFLIAPILTLLIHLPWAYFLFLS